MEPSVWPCGYLLLKKIIVIVIIAVIIALVLHAGMPAGILE